MNTTSYTYDTLNRIVSETNPLDGTKTFHYDKDSRIVGVTDRNGVRTSYKLDGNGNIIESIDGEGHSSFFEYDEMDRLTKVTLRRIDKLHKVDEIQETLYTYDHRGLVKTEINAAGDGKALIYDGNGNLIQKTDEDGYVTEYEYSPVNLVSKAGYADGKTATYLYDSTGDLIRMVDWVGETTFEYDLLDRLLNVNDHNDWNVNYVYDNVGNTRYYTKDNGQSFAELEYDVWGAVTSPSKLTNNDNGNFAAAVFTGHPYDTVLDIYFAEARFYDANHRQWMASDPIKSGLNWYLYVEGNPATFFDPSGLLGEGLYGPLGDSWLRDKKLHFGNGYDLEKPSYSGINFNQIKQQWDRTWIGMQAIGSAFYYMPALKSATHLKEVLAKEQKSKSAKVRLTFLKTVNLT